MLVNRHVAHMVASDNENERTNLDIQRLRSQVETAIAKAVEKGCF